MTRKKRQEASHRMKQIWAKRRAASKPIVMTWSESNSVPLPAAQPLIDVIPAGEVHDIIIIVDFIRKLSPNGRKFIIKKFTPNA